MPKIIYVPIVDHMYAQDWCNINCVNWCEFQEGQGHFQIWPEVAYKYELWQNMSCGRSG